MSNNIYTLSLNELLNKLSSKEVSPIEVLDSYIAQIEKHANLNAFVTTCFEEARSIAKDQKFNSKDALSCLPIAIKDVILTKDIKTTCCSKILNDFIPPYNATVTNKLSDSGSYCIGKTNMDEFAMGSSNENSIFGPVLNPWDTSKVPGGSSGGSAVAVSARMAPVALGTDTGGSIRQPASFCGTVGLKPTYGRNSRYGVIAFASSLDQVGVFSNSVLDCAIASEILAGKDIFDATSADLEVPDWQSFCGKDAVSYTHLTLPTICSV